MIVLTPSQKRIVARNQTNPVFLIDTWWGEDRKWSTLGDREVDGVLYSGGQAGLVGSLSWTSADIVITPSRENVALMINGEWREKPCDVYLYPYKVNPLLVVPGYAKEGYGFFGDEYADPVLLHRGVLAAASFSGRDKITLTSRHSATVGKRAPRIRFAPPLCNFLTVPGTRTEWAGEVYVLEARK